MIRFRSLAALAALLLSAVCATPRQATGAQVASTSSTGVKVDTLERRALPDPLQPPEAFQRAVERGTRTYEGVPGPDHWVNRPTYALDVRLLPEEKRLEGTARIRYKNNSPDSLGLLVLEIALNYHKKGVLRLFPGELTGGMTIERVAVNGNGLEQGREERPTYRMSGTRLIIAPAAPVLPGETVSLEIDYHYRIPKRGVDENTGYNGEQVYGETNLFHIAYFYPVMAVYEDVQRFENIRGWMADRFLGNAEFYSDHGVYDVSITAPSEWMIQATGVLQNPEEVLRPEIRQRRQRAYQSDEPVMILTPGQRATPEGADTLTWAFHAEDVRDVVFTAMKAGDWHWEAARTEVGDRDGDGQVDYTHINAFWRSKAPLWSEMVGYEQHAISFLSDYTGLPYPWPHMSAVEVGSLLSGGVEFPMTTAISPYRDGEPHALYGVTAHELSHMWVPMIVSTNERRFGWMDEGIATFNSAAAMLDRYPESDARPYIQNQKSYLEAVEAGVDAPIMRWSDYHYRPAGYSVASYPKTASMLRALRGLLGEEAFMNAYRRFYEVWAYKHPMPQDFFNIFETAHGAELDWFWDSFFYETWTLDHAIASVEDTENGVRVTVRDEGRAVMPVELTLTLEGGETVRRHVPVDAWLNGKRTVTVTIPTDAPAVRAELDARHFYPDADRSDNVWTRS